MEIFGGSGRKDTGRTDKYSDETPKKDYQDYRSDVSPKKEAREIKEKSPTTHVGRKSIEVRKQEFISHIQNYRENFNSAELNVWQNQLSVLKQKLEGKD